jgi:hypothetical protein
MPGSRAERRTDPATLVAYAGRAKVSTGHSGRAAARGVVFRHDDLVNDLSTEDPSSWDPRSASRPGLHSGGQLNPPGVSDMGSSKPRHE